MCQFYNFCNVSILQSSISPIFIKIRIAYMAEKLVQKSPLIATVYYVDIVFFITFTIKNLYNCIY